MKIITMNNVLSKIYYNDGWKHLSDADCQKYFDMMRDWLVSQCSRSSKICQDLKNAQVKYIRSYGILDRLWIELETNKVQYCAGQDYISEINLVKRIIAGRKVR